MKCESFDAIALGLEFCEHNRHFGRISMAGDAMIVFISPSIGQRRRSASFNHKNGWPVQVLQRLARYAVSDRLASTRRGPAELKNFKKGKLL